ncbi:secretion system protein E, partial [Methanoculleus bourgensis]
MRAGEDEERELIATVRNLLTQSRKPGSSGEEVASSPPGDRPGEEEVREEAIPEDEGQPDPSPAPAPRGAGIRSLIDSVLGSGGAGQRRASGNGDPARALLERIGESGAESGGEDATSPEAVEDMETEPEMPASPPERRDPFGIFAGRKKEADTSAPNDPGAATADEPVIPARGHRASPGLPDPEVEEEPETDENISAGVVSVDELGNLADLILPKGATFEVEELHIKRNERQFDFVDNARVVSEFDELFTEAFSSATLAAAAAATEVPVEDVPEPRFGFLERFHLPKTVEVIEEYNPVLHGPLVDLSMRPSPGLEEIELYPVNEPYAYVRVTYDSTTHEYTYNVLEPVLTPGEQELFGEIKERLFETLDITTRDLTRDEARKALRDAANTIIADYGIRLEPPGREKILYHVEKEFLGDGLIDPVMHDGYIEDISCDGVGSTIFVYHTTYESMKTSLVYRDAAELDSF